MGDDYIDLSCPRHITSLRDSLGSFRIPQHVLLLVGSAYLAPGCGLQRTAMQTMLLQQPSVCQVEFDDGVNTGHSYASKVASEGVAPRSRQARIGKELAGLAASLPITLSSSVFVRVDQTHMTLWKALITGESIVTCVDACNL